MAKEQEWSAAKFTKLDQALELHAALKATPLRVNVTLSPDELSSLLKLLADNVKCRSTGDKAAFERLCRPSDARATAPNELQMHAGVLRERYDTDVQDRASAEQVFQKYWEIEYAPDAATRFAEVAFGDGGAVIVIDEARQLDVFCLLDEAEQARWITWVGAGRLKSAILFRGPREVADVIRAEGSCTVAEAVLTVRSMGGDVWIWYSRWMLDRQAGGWSIAESAAVSRRRLYKLPF